MSGLLEMSVIEHATVRLACLSPLRIKLRKAINKMHQRRASTDTVTRDLRLLEPFDQSGLAFLGNEDVIGRDTDLAGVLRNMSELFKGLGKV